MHYFIFNFAVYVFFLKNFANGAPLESPSDDFSRFFDQRIVGGAPAPPNKAAYMAALILGYQLKAFLCGGSILTRKHIMTAAHCIMNPHVGGSGILNRSFHAVVGSNNWWSGGTALIFTSFTTHPQYDSVHLKFDVGILTLWNALVFSHSIQPIALETGRVAAGETTMVTGWGAEQLGGNAPYYLQFLNTNIISNELCQEEVEKAAHKEELDWEPFVNPKVEICTFHSPGHGMCNGDSGSPLVSLRTGRQVGIVSWGFACAIGAPDVFVRVDGVVDYIQAAVSDKYVDLRESISAS